MEKKGIVDDFCIVFSEQLDINWSQSDLNPFWIRGFILAYVMSMVGGKILPETHWKWFGWWMTLLHDMKLCPFIAEDKQFCDTNEVASYTTIDYEEFGFITLRLHPATTYKLFDLQQIKFFQQPKGGRRPDQSVSWLRLFAKSLSFKWNPRFAGWKGSGARLVAPLVWQGPSCANPVGLFTGDMFDVEIGTAYMLWYWKIVYAWQGPGEMIMKWMKWSDKHSRRWLLKHLQISVSEAKRWRSVSVLELWVMWMIHLRCFDTVANNERCMTLNVCEIKWMHVWLYCSICSW